MKDVIAIDGPAGAGKSTLARHLAEKLGFLYLDTGALYRALTWKALQLKVPLDSEPALGKLARASVLDLRAGPGGLAVFIDGAEVTGEIRTPEVTRHTFYIARSPGVRKALLPVQRRFARRENLVAEGRDTTTVVFPGATLKVYLDASLETRADRRRRDLEKNGVSQDLAQVMAEIEERDNHDLSRETAPLRRASDAVYFRNDRLGPAETVDRLAEIYRRRAGTRRPRPAAARPGAQI